MAYENNNRRKDSVEPEENNRRGQGRQEKNQSKNKRRHRNRSGSNNGGRRNNDNRSDSRSAARGLYADPQSDGTNDISWYTENPELVAVTSRLAWPYRPGMTLDAGHITGPVNCDGKVRIPGVMEIDFTPTIGWSDRPNSPASICAARMWQQIRSHFSSDLVVGPPDVFMYIYGIGNIHAYINNLKRIYRAVNTYFADNFDYPKNIFRACVSTSTDEMNEALWIDTRNNRHVLYTAINEMVNAINALRVPDQYPILHRMRWMNEHIYLDEPRITAQSYVFHQDAYFKVDDTGDNGTALHLVGPSLVPTIQNYIDFGWELINAMTGWEDAYTISGYIYKAFEKSQAYFMTLLAENEVLNPVYVPEMLVQIENANISPIKFQVGTGVDSITQDPATDTIFHRPGGEVSIKLERNMFNTHGDMSDAMAIVGTRLASMAGEFDPNTEKVKLVCGTEVVTGIHLIQGGSTSDVDDYFALSTLGSGQITVKSNSSITAGEWVSFAKAIKGIIQYQYWHHHPILYRTITYTSGYASDSDAATWRNENAFMPQCDLDLVTQYSAEWLQNLNRAVLYSLFNCFNKDRVIQR